MVKSWRLLFFLAAISGLVSNVAGLRATSLIFGRGPNGTLTPTTSTTTSTASSGSSSAPTSSPVISAGIANGTDSVIDDEQANETDEVTKPPLTGIPQIDYVWDPNLPHELNGYNLSTYPFLSLVPSPDDIDFRCDGLHDGFYASLKYSCQLYHHCIYGIRHDFLCANFTAFDQKTFICQFVSEVNCKASPKYYFRNDALYIAMTTTSTTTTTIAPPVTQPPQYNDRPLRPRRPLQRPRRPVQPVASDYYDDDDEYEQDDYVEEQRYTRRRNQPLRGRTRRPQQQQQYDDYDGQQPQQQAPSQGRRFADDANDRRPNRNRNPSAYDYEEDEELPRQRNRNGGRRRNQQPLDDRYENAPQRPAVNGQRNSDAQAPPPRRKQVDQQRAQRPKQPQRYDDADDPDYDDRPATSQNRYAEDDAPKVSPSGGGSALFSRPRAPPRINRPVPLNDKRKYEYGASKSAKPTTTTSRPAVADDGYETEYEDDYQDAAPAPVNSNNNDRSTTLNRETRRPASIPKKPAATPAPVYEDDDLEDEEPPAPVRNQYKPVASPPSRKVQSRQPAVPAVVVESRQKQRVPLVNAYSDEQEDEPQPPRTKVSRRPAPAINAYSDEDETIAEEEVRAPVVQQRPTNQRPRIIQSRPLASGESRSFPRKTQPAVAEIYAEDEDEEDVAEIAGPTSAPVPPPPPPPRRSNRHNSVRPRVNPPPAVAQLPEDIRPVRRYEDSVGSSKFRQQFRTRDQAFRTSTTSTTSTTTATPLDDSDYASDEYEDEEEPIVAPAATQPPPPPRSALNKSQHRFAAPAATTTDTARPTVSKLSGKFPPSGRAAAADTSDEYFEPGTGEGTAPALDSTAATRTQMVRVVKRPFLPSRGGNPYLPRGLKPLGPVERDGPVYADEETATGHLDLGPTISGAKLLEFHPPLVSREPIQIASTSTTTSTTTARPPPAREQLDPNRKLEEIFSSELDVTLNDALNPTLKPLSRSSPIGFSFKYSPSYYEPPANRRDSAAADEADLAQQSQIHSSAIHAPFYGTTAGGQSRSAPVAAASVAADSEFYSDYEY